jgi:uncharacterized membrane protein
MSEIAVAIFPDQIKAREAADAVAGPVPPNDLVVHGAALLVKEADGTVSHSKWTSRVPWKAPFGALVGALVGFLGGPIGAAIGFTAGGWLGFAKVLSDTAHAEAFMRQIHSQLSPGKSALVVELDEQSMKPFAAHAREFGGVILDSV